MEVEGQNDVENGALMIGRVSTGTCLNESVHYERACMYSGIRAGLEIPFLSLYVKGSPASEMV